MRRAVWRFSPKTKNGLTTRLSNSTLGYKTKTLFQKDTCNPMFTAALFTIVKIWKQLTCLSNKGVVYIATLGYCSAIKKNEIVPFEQQGWTWRVLCLVKWQTEKDKDCMVSLMCGI